MGPAFTVRVAGIRARAGFVTPATIVVATAGAASTLDRPRMTELALTGFACVAVVAVVMLHTTARIAVYRRLGVVVRELDLSLAGGMPSLLDRSDSPRRDALAGLTGLFVIIPAAAGAWAFARTAQSGTTHDAAHLIAAAIISFAVLQAMPALPLDGGRLVRSFVWFMTGDALQGSRATAVYGHLIAGALIMGGTLMLPERGELPYWGFGAIVAGFQLASACAASYRESRWQAIGSRVAIVDAGLPLPGRITRDQSVEAAVDALIAEGSGAVLLVVDGSGAATGVIRLDDLRRTRRADWGVRTAADVMTPLASLPQISAGTTAVDALSEMDRAGTQLAVVRIDPKRVVLVRRDQLLDLLVARAIDPSTRPPVRPSG